MFTVLLNQRLYGRYSLIYVSQFNNHNTRRALTTQKLREYYSLLNVDKNSSPKEIKESFLKLSKVYHPDNKVSGSHLKFVKLKEAFDAVKDGNPSVTDDFRPYQPNPFTTRQEDYQDLTHRAHARYREATREQSKTGYWDDRSYGFGGPYSRSSTPWEDLKQDREYKRTKHSYPRASPLVGFTIIMSALAWMVIYSCVIFFWESRFAERKIVLTRMRNQNYPDIQSYDEYLKRFDREELESKIEKMIRTDDKNGKGASDNSDNENSNLKDSASSDALSSETTVVFDRTPKILDVEDLDHEVTKSDTASNNFTD